MNLRRLQTELAASLTGLGYTVYDDPIKAAAGMQLPAVVIGLPDDVTLQNKVRALVTMPVHVIVSTADSKDALQRISDSSEFRADKNSVLGGLMSATSNCWTSVDVESVSGFNLVSVGANQSALMCDITVVIHSIQTND